MLVLAHREWKGRYENTLKSFRRLGRAHGIETDVRLTGDGW